MMLLSVQSSLTYFFVSHHMQRCTAQLTTLLCASLFDYFLRNTFLSTNLACFDRSEICSFLFHSFLTSFVFLLSYFIPGSRGLYPAQGCGTVIVFPLRRWPEAKWPPCNVRVPCIIYTRPTRRNYPFSCACC